MNPVDGSFTCGGSIMPSVRDISQALGQWAPEPSAQSYDNVGLQVGNPDRSVQNGLIALDLTAEVIAEARTQGADLIITHHPLLFNEVSRLTTETRESSLALRLAEEQIAYYAIHTNLDAASGGVSYALAHQLGLEDVDFLQPMADVLYKLVVFVPTDHQKAVRLALAEAGAGQIGEYDACAFETDGTGYFRASETADPYTGKAGGEIESADEVRLEVELPRWKLGAVVGAMKEAHPYEQVAYDVYPVQQPYTRAGLGARGQLPEPEPLRQFVQRVANKLDTDRLDFVGNETQTIQDVAVCGGAGGDFIPNALSSGADVYVTSDLSYHDFFRPLDDTGTPTMALVDAGHYETERVTESLLVEWLDDRFGGVNWNRTAHRTSPIQTYLSD